MKRDKRFPRCGRFIDLAELVRKRSRYQPYDLRANLNAAYSVESIYGPAWRGRFNNMDLLSHVRRSSIVGRRTLAVASSSSDRVDRAISAHISHTSMHTHTDAYSQTSSCVVNAANEVLEQLPAENGESANDASSVSNNHSNDDTEQNEDRSCPQVAAPTNQQQQLHVASVFGSCMPRLRPLTMAEMENAQAHVQAQEQEQQPTSVESIGSHAPDEEAGGDGHHNDSLIEIEITLRSVSGNDGDDEEDDEEENDVRVINRVEEEEEEESE